MHRHFVYLVQIVTVPRMKAVNAAEPLTVHAGFHLIVKHISTLYNNLILVLVDIIWWKWEWAGHSWLPGDVSLIPEFSPTPPGWHLRPWIKSLDNDSTSVRINVIILFELSSVQNCNLLMKLLIKTISLRCALCFVLIRKCSHAIILSKDDERDKWSACSTSACHPARR